MSEAITRSLDQQREEFAGRRFLAMPLSGAIVWLVVAVASQLLPPLAVVWVLFIGTGSIVYLAMLISNFTGERFLDKSRPKNVFDTLLYYSLFASWLAFAIAIPFFQVDYTSLPLSVGILTCTMWVPFSWIIQHPVGLIHALARTGLIVIGWYLFPDQRFLVIPLIIVSIYLITIYVLERRWQARR